MKRFFAWLSAIGSQPSARSVIDLPEQFGGRMRLGQVRGLFQDPKNREAFHAVAQLLWMHRSAAAEEAMNGAMKSGRTDAYLGQMSGMDNVLADFQLLMADRLEDAHGKKVEWEPTKVMERWFKGE